MHRLDLRPTAVSYSGSEGANQAGGFMGAGPLIPEDLLGRGVIEPLGFLSYFQQRSAFVFSPALKLPLPSLSLPPRLAHAG